VAAYPVLALPRVSRNCPSHWELASGEPLLPLPPDGGGARGGAGGRPIVGAARSSPRGSCHRRRRGRQGDTTYL
jgi:hypothetical protein